MSFFLFVKYSNLYVYKEKKNYKKKKIMDNTFFTRQKKHKSNFEKKYIERFGGTNEYPQGLPSLSPRIMEKKEEMQETNAELEEARNKFEAWKTNFGRKKREIDEKQRALDVQKENLKIFTEHHNIEIEKAKKKEQDEKQKIVEMQARYAELCKTEEELHEKNEDLKKKVDKLQPFADYMQAVVDKTHYFENVESILNRFETLTETRAEYVQKFQQVMDGYGTDEEAMSKQLTEKRAALLGKEMQLNRSKQEVSAIKQQNQYQKSTMVKDMQRLDQKNTELAEIKSAIRTIFQRALDKSITNAQRASAGTNPTLEEMIEFIRNRYHDLSGILNDPEREYAPFAPPAKQKMTAK